jgi:hypothetical protein
METCIRGRVITGERGRHAYVAVTEWIGWERGLMSTHGHMFIGMAVII